jgi:hypothetical protein
MAKKNETKASGNKSPGLKYLGKIITFGGKPVTHVKTK